MNEPVNDFAFGVRSMARNCLPACDLIRTGRWNIDDMERWLNAVIYNDNDYLAVADAMLKERAKVRQP